MKRCTSILLRAGLALAFLLVCGTVRAQYFSEGAEPAGVRWSKIDGRNYSVIYPLGMDSLAREYLFQFEKSRPAAQNSYSVPLLRMPIVLHPYAIGGESTVAWGPRRIEVFTTPEANGGLPQDHAEQVAVSGNYLLGYMSHYDREIFRILEYPFGQQSIALGVGFYPSVWQALGNADLHLTDMTSGGPGRSAEYLMYYRAAFVLGDVRSYDDWHYGSYHRYVPPKRSFGYMVTNNMRFYSDSYTAMEDVLDIQIREWYDVFGVWNRSFLEASGKTVRKHWRYITAYNTTLWSDEYNRRAPYDNPEKLLQREESLYTEFRDLLPVGDGFFATKRGMQYPSELVQITPEGRQKRLQAFSANASRIVSDDEGRLFWSEQVPDPRWELRSYSIIRTRDSKTGNVRDLTSRTRLFNPVLAPDGKSLYAAEYAPDGTFAIVRVDAGNGSIISRSETPKRSQVTEMAIFGGRLYALAITGGGMGLFSRPLEDETAIWQQEIAPQSSKIQQISACDEGLCLTGEWDGVCEPYIYTPSDGKLTRLANVPFGGFYPTLTSEGLYLTDYDNLGAHPSFISKDSLKLKECDPSEVHPDHLAERAAEQYSENQVQWTDTGLALLKSEIDTLEVKPYKKAAHGIRIHSWAPLYPHIDRINPLTVENALHIASPGVYLLSQNTLGTLTMQGGYAYDNYWTEGHRRHTGHLDIQYSGLYPVIEAGVSVNEFRTASGHSSVRGHTRVYIPWNLSRGGWKENLVPSLEYSFTNESRHDITAGLSYSRSLERTKRQLSPRLGMAFDGRLRSIYEPEGKNMMAFARGTFYLPGITPDHNIKLAGTWQHMLRDSGHRSLERMGFTPRGFEGRLFDNLSYAGASFDYGMFIWGGDLCWPWLFYLKRLQFIPFADFAWAYKSPADRPLPDMRDPGAHPMGLPSNQFFSVGADLLIGLHFIRIGSEINIGVRYAHTSDGWDKFSLIFGNNLK